MQPIAEGAPLPSGEVLLGNRAALELGCEDCADFGQGIEPCDENVSRDTVAEETIEGFADVEREVGDFSFAFHRWKRCGGVVADRTGGGVG